MGRQAGRQCSTLAVLIMPPRMTSTCMTPLRRPAPKRSSTVCSTPEPLLAAAALLLPTTSHGTQQPVAPTRQAQAMMEC